MKLSRREFLSKYGYVLSFLYILIHIAWFFWLGRRTDVSYRIIHSPLDDMIPFCEWFIIPYVLWFIYLFGGAVYFLFLSRKDYIRFMMFTFGGCFICMLICTFYPSMIDFRPTSFSRDNPLIRLVELIYASDTPTSVFPSMHCFGAIGTTVAVFRAEHFRGRHWVKAGCFAYMLIVFAATVFIKQHSVLDVFASIPLALLLYPVVYCIKWKFLDGPDIRELLPRRARKSGGKA